MSPTSYQAAPPRIKSVTERQRSVKSLGSSRSSQRLIAE